MPPTPNSAPLPKPLAFLRGFSVLGLLVGGLFLVAGGLRATERYLQATKWPAVEARVDKCEIHRYYHVQSHVSGEQDQVRCAFEYEANGVTYHAVKDAGSSIFHSAKQIVLVQPKITRGKLAQWIALHPSGSWQTIHYDPADPRQISLAGADDDIQENTAAIQLKIAATLLSVSLALLLASFAVRKKDVTPSGSFASERPAV